MNFVMFPAEVIKKNGNIVLSKIIFFANIIQAQSGFSFYFGAGPTAEWVLCLKEIFQSKTQFSGGWSLDWLFLLCS